ncbi:uncharacterized protein LOC129636267 isoform X1 [Bubalus kerabau]|uniref:uncharacterized protein LOC129636267 isoform X1 n=1 Tax=Bubalus carabanensis TaxID=3119969 RepID=UPI00244E770B|nr:uncharacterized protein LOC129636267 isoform X1 [Bubalus carabanensis]
MVFPFSSCGERGLLFLVVLRLLTVVASLVAHGLQGAGVMGSRAQASWAPERRRHGLQSAGVMGSRAQASWAPERRRHGLQSAGVMGSRAQASWAPERRRHGLQSAGVMGSRAQASWAAAHVLSSCGAQASAAPRRYQAGCSHPSTRSILGSRFPGSCELCHLGIQQDRETHGEGLLALIYSTLERKRVTLLLSTGKKVSPAQ